MVSRFKHIALAVALLAALVGGFALAPSAQHAGAQDEGFRQVPLHVSAARTATGVGPTVCGLANFNKFAVQLVVTAASGTSPTLDLTWQHSIDGGTTWYTVVAFTQATTTTTALKVESEVEAATAEVWGDCMRASYVIGGTTPSFTFRVDLFAEN